MAYLDFAPLQTGNTWTYRRVNGFALLEFSAVEANAGNGSSRLTVEVESIASKTEGRKRLLRIRDSGTRFETWISTHDTIAFDTTWTQEVESIGDSVSVSGDFLYRFMDRHKVSVPEVGNSAIPFGNISIKLDSVCGGDACEVAFTRSYLHFDTISDARTSLRHTYRKDVGLVLASYSRIGLEGLWHDSLILESSSRE